MEKDDIKKVIHYHIHETNNGIAIAGSYISLLKKKIEKLNIPEDAKISINMDLDNTKKSFKRISDSVDYTYVELSKIWK